MVESFPVWAQVVIVFYTLGSVLVGIYGGSKADLRDEGGVRIIGAAIAWMVLWPLFVLVEALLEAWRVLSRRG